MILTMNNSNDEIINRILFLMQTDDSKDAPQASVKWSKNLFRSRVVKSEKSLMQKVLAVLKVDLSGAQSAFGERSGAIGKARQMLFEAGEIAVDLRIGETKKGFNLQGQILGEGFAEVTIKLGEFEGKTNELSEFQFTNIPSGIYTMILQSGEKIIVIEELELK